MDLLDPVVGDGVHPWAFRSGVNKVRYARPAPFEQCQAVDGPLALAAGQHKPANAVVDPHAFLYRPVANPLVSRYDDEMLPTDDREPPVVEAAPGHRSKVRMAG